MFSLRQQAQNRGGGVCARTSSDWPRFAHERSWTPVSSSPSDTFPAPGRIGGVHQFKAGSRLAVRLAVYGVVTAPPRHGRLARDSSPIASVPTIRPQERFLHWPESRSRRRGHPFHTGVAEEHSTRLQLRLGVPPKRPAASATVGARRPAWLVCPQAPGGPPEAGSPRSQPRCSEWPDPGSPWRAAAGARNVAAEPVASRPSPGPASQSRS